MYQHLDIQAFQKYSKFREQQNFETVLIAFVSECRQETEFVTTNSCQICFPELFFSILAFLFM